MNSHSCRFFILLALCAIIVESSCNSIDHELVSKAFQSVSGFNVSWFPTQDSNCSKSSQIITSITLPSKNLTGAISWAFIKNMSHLKVLDLSGNFLQGQLPRWLWKSSTLSKINLSNNKFGGSIELDYTKIFFLFISSKSQSFPQQVHQSCSTFWILKPQNHRPLSQQLKNSPFWPSKPHQTSPSRPLKLQNQSKRKAHFFSSFSNSLRLVKQLFQWHLPFRFPSSTKPQLPQHLSQQLHITCPLKQVQTIQHLIFH